MNILCKTTLENFDEWIFNAALEGAMALIDKDKGWTSFDVVAKLKSLTKIKKVGHAGTLDPLASGLMVLCFGKATKKINEFQMLKKRYSVVIKLGATTKSFDRETVEENFKSLDKLKADDILEVIFSFKGRTMQVPPAYSAKWVNGVRAYKAARANREVALMPVEVDVSEISINKIELPFINFDVECSKGTYIRSLARDIGLKLGCGAYLIDLRRTGIGDYLVSDALTVNEIIESIKLQKEIANT